MHFHCRTLDTAVCLMEEPVGLLSPGASGVFTKTHIQTFFPLSPDFGYVTTNTSESLISRSWIWSTSFGSWIPLISLNPLCGTSSWLWVFTSIKSMMAKATWTQRPFLIRCLLVNQLKIALAYLVFFSSSIIECVGLLFITRQHRRSRQLNFGISSSISRGKNPKLQTWKQIRGGISRSIVGTIGRLSLSFMNILHTWTARSSVRPWRNDVHDAFNMIPLLLPSRNN